MKFILINAAEKSATVEDHANLDAAKRKLAIDPKSTDHGQFQRGLAYVVYEYGLFMPKEHQHYCRVGNTLIGGNLVVYAYDEAGETIDVTDEMLRSFIPNVAFFADHAEVETAIKRGIVRRPRMAQGSKVLWQWPEPAPKDFPVPAEFRR